MNPEEFDNRLKSSFQDEYLPPKEQLWQNISQRLDQDAKKPFWYWVVPLLIVVAAGVAWIGNTVSSPGLGEKTAVVASPDADKSPATLDRAVIETDKTTPVAEDANNNSPEKIVTTPVPDHSNAAQPSTGRKPSGEDRSKSRMARNNSANGSAGGIGITGTFGKTILEADSRIKDHVGNQANQSTSSVDNDENIKLRLFSFPHFPAKYDLGKMDYIANDRVKTKPRKDEPPKRAYRSNFNNADLESKWWFSFGMGAQAAFNSMVSKSDSQAWIHKDLWANRNKLTHNGSGFHSHAYLNFKLGKRFIFETGLNYSLRTEDIRFNETSFDIAYRSNTDGKINGYTPITLIVISPKTPPQTGYDTTYYNAVANFSMVQKNKYHVITLPFNLKTEHKLSDNTFLAAGLGGGLSMIYTKKAGHMNMVNEKEVFQEKTKQFSGSVNASLAIYTNFNDIGQIGLYTGYQMYLQPWKTFQNQYSVKMSDLQFGVVFRKPLNWGK